MENKGNVQRKINKKVENLQTLQTCENHFANKQSCLVIVNLFCVCDGFLDRG